MAKQISLGGKTVEIDGIPFGLLKKLQPRYVKCAAATAELANGGIDDEAQIIEMGEIVRLVMATADKEMTVERFDDLRFSAFDLVDAFQATGAAIGLVRAGAGESQPAQPASSTGTT